MAGGGGKSGGGGGGGEGKVQEAKGVGMVKWYEARTRLRFHAHLAALLVRIRRLKGAPVDLGDA
jgi:hypothetical protein